MKCPLCQHDGAPVQVLRSRCRFNGTEIVRYQCPACDVIFGPLNMIYLPADLLALEYIDLYGRYSEADQTEREVEVFRRLGPRRGGRYLDYGSGKSRTVEVLRADGYDVVGYDFAVPPAHAAELSQPYDGIFSHNVIEHLQDPVGTFGQLGQLLKPGARMAHWTTCYEYDTPDTRFHLFFFLGRSIDVLCARAGLRVVEREPCLGVFACG